MLLHVLVAIGLLLGSLSLLGQAIVIKNRAWVITSAVGVLGVITALTNGLAFIGYNKDVNSFVMAMGFLAAAVAYSTALSFGVNVAKNPKPVNAGTAADIRRQKLRPRHS